MTAPHDPLGEFRSEAVALLQEALHSLRYDPTVVADVPTRLAPAPVGKGDFTLACFPVAKVARKAPPAIAQEVAAAVPASSRLVFTAEGAYVNVRIDPRALADVSLKSVAHHAPRYGSFPATGASVILEHTSANPNGPFHVGRARNPILGDTLARVLRAAGHAVTTEYYVNDMGKQVAILAWGVANLKPSDVTAPEREKIDHVKVGYYQKANEIMEKDPKVAEAIHESLRRFEAGDEAAAFAFREAASLVLKGMRESMERLGVRMDSFYWESDLVRSGEVARVVESLKRAPVAAEEEGAWFLDLAEHGIAGQSKKWFFLRRDGTSLYTTRDLAYHRNKFSRADRLVNVLGEDHKLTMQQLAIALEYLGEDRVPEVVWYAFVSLPEGKMSTRRGRVVFIDDLMDEAQERALHEVRVRRSGELSEDEMTRVSEIVGIGALRFNILSVQAEKGITFRWEDALNFEGASAPFVQYAHARAASILEKAGGAPKHGLLHLRHHERLTHPSEEALVKQIARLPGLVRECAEGLKSHPLTSYAVELAMAFNAFYRDCPVLTAEDAATRDARLELVDATRTTLASALHLLGIVAPDTM